MARPSDPRARSHDVTVTEVKDCLGSVSRESRQVVEEGNVYTVPALCILLLGRSLQDPNEILNTHRRSLASLLLIRVSWLESENIVRRSISLCITAM